MHCIKKVTDDLIWVGANDRRLALFEGVYSVPAGVSYNSYLLLDEKTILFDTVDKAVAHRFIENVDKALAGRSIDYLVVQHMEPDHSSALSDILRRYPGVQIVCTARTADMMKRFFGIETAGRSVIVKEGDTLKTGRHTLHFVMAPMVHWPEVMVTYDSADKILFSADAFGCFGALNGALFADEVDFGRDYMDEARRYYTNIVGKYGTQVQALLKKAGALDIQMICPLHGFVWRKNLGEFIEKYDLWSRYEPEEYGVCIAYASVYGNTENAAEILASRLRDRGIKTVMFDVSVTPASEIVSAAFKWSHLVFASTTYNAGIFVTMEALVSDLVSHNIQNRTAAIIENGSWAATAGGLIAEKLQKCKNISILDDNRISIRSALAIEQLTDIDRLAGAIADNIAPNLAAPIAPVVGASPATSGAASAPASVSEGKGVDANTMFKLTYGLYVLTAKDGDKDNGCIINTAVQITVTPLRIMVAVNKANYTCEIISKTGEFNISALTESAPFSVFERFGFKSGRDTDKFAGSGYDARSANGITYIPESVNGVISAKVVDTHDYGTHLLFIADVTEAFSIDSERSLSYQYYFDHIKPKPKPPEESKKGFVCKICGYVHEGEELPEDFVCPLCKHGAADFERL